MAKKAKKKDRSAPYVKREHKPAYRYPEWVRTGNIPEDIQRQLQRARANPYEFRDQDRSVG